MANPHHEALIDSLSKRMGDEKYADLTIVCGNKQWRVHKVVLSSSSKVIERELDSKMKEGNTSIIEHDQFDEETVGRMICYMYKRFYEVEEAEEQEETVPQEVEKEGDKDEGQWAVAVSSSHGWRALSVQDETEEQQPTKSNKNTKNTLLAHVAAHAIADYYEIPTLQTYAAERFKATAESSTNLTGLIEVLTAVLCRPLPSDSELRIALRDHVFANRVALVKDAEFMDSLAKLPDAHGLIVDLFGEMVSLLADKEAEVKDLKQDSNHHWMSNRNNRERLDNLTKALKQIPTKCRNQNCSKTFDTLTFEEKSSFSYEWRIRCKQCKCKLVE